MNRRPQQSKDAPRPDALPSALVEAPPDPSPFAARQARARRRRLAIGAGSVLAHLGVLLVLFPARRDPPPAEPPAMTVALVDLAPQAPPPTPTAPSPPQAAKPPPPRNIARPTPLRPKRPALAADPKPTAVVEPGLTDGQLAGAATAGSGAPGGGCNMLRALQAALRKDPLVQAAAADPQRAGKALMVWNGDWVRDSSQEGRGLAAIREAILWEVGFAPAACRTETVHGLVLISLGDAPGAVRLAVGAGQWRWADLLALHHIGADDAAARRE